VRPSNSRFMPTINMTSHPRRQEHYGGTDLIASCLYNSLIFQELGVSRFKGGVAEGFGVLCWVMALLYVPGKGHLQFESCIYSQFIKPNI